MSRSGPGLVATREASAARPSSRRVFARFTAFEVGNVTATQVAVGPSTVYDIAGIFASFRRRILRPVGRRGPLMETSAEMATFWPPTRCS